METQRFSHIGQSGTAQMVNVTAKTVTRRRAIARARVSMSAETASQIGRGTLEKGDVLAMARLAGIQAAKRTPLLIPLCHQINIASTFVSFNVTKEAVDIEAEVEATDRTGVEMEALTACTVAALTIYDMCKSIDDTLQVHDIALWEKDGGRSGGFLRDELDG